MTSSKTRRELRDVSEMERRGRHLRPASGCYYINIICGDPLGIGRRKAPVFRHFLRSRARAIGAV